MPELANELEVCYTATGTFHTGCCRMLDAVKIHNNAARNLLDLLEEKGIYFDESGVGRKAILAYQKAKDFNLIDAYENYRDAANDLCILRDSCRYGGEEIYDGSGSVIVCGSNLPSISQEVA